MEWFDLHLILLDGLLVTGSISSNDIQQNSCTNILELQQISLSSHLFIQSSILKSLNPKKCFWFHMNVYLILSSILLLTNLKQKCSSQLAEQISNTRKSGFHFEKRREKGVGHGHIWASMQPKSSLWLWYARCRKRLCSQWLSNSRISSACSSNSWHDDVQESNSFGKNWLC